MMRKGDSNTPGDAEYRARWNRVVGAAGCACDFNRGSCDLLLFCVSTGLRDGKPLLPDRGGAAIALGEFPFVGHRFRRFLSLSGLFLCSAIFFPESQRRFGHPGADFLLDGGVGHNPSDLASAQGSGFGETSARGDNAIVQARATATCVETRYGGRARPAAAIQS